MIPSLRHLAGLLLLLGLCLASVNYSPPATAGESLTFNHLGAEEGLPQGTITDIVQDRHGFIWVGTFAGLYRYDGYQFLAFKHDPRDPHSISDNVVSDLFEDRAGNLWIGTLQGGLNRLRPDGSGFDRYLSEDSDYTSLSHSNVTSIWQDAAGRLWVGTQAGLDLFLAEQQSFVQFVTNPLDQQSLPPGRVVALVGDGQQGMWVATQTMLSHFDPEQQVFTRYDPTRFANAPSQINTLYRDRDNSLWIGTQNRGLFHLDINEQRFAQYAHDSDKAFSLSSNNVRDVLRDKLGNLWVATETGGLNFKPKGSERFYAFTRNSSDPHSLKINDIWSLLQDTSGLLWVGSAGGGLYKTAINLSGFDRLLHNPTDSNSLSHPFVWDIKEDRSGQLWFATLNGVDRFDPVTQTISHLSDEYPLPQDVSTRTHAIAFDDKGRLWLGTQDGEVLVKENGRYAFVERPGQPARQFSQGRIFMLEFDGEHMWAGTTEGLARINTDSLHIEKDFTYVDDNHIGSALVRTMLAEGNQYLWFGTWGSGLQRLDPEFDMTLTLRHQEGDPHSLSNDIVRALYLAPNGDLWIGTFNGLNLLSREERESKRFHFKSYLEADGLASAAIYGILPDGSGNLWLSTNAGLSRFNPSSEHFTNYDIEDGLPANEFNGGAAVKSQQGILYFGSPEGVALIDPFNIRVNKFQPAVRLTSLEIRNHRAVPPLALLDIDSLQLDYHQNDLRVAFSSLDYSHSNRNRFQYRLLPYQSEWLDSDKRNEVSYTNLDPGEYQLQIKGSNSDGVWSDEIRRLNIIITPPLWATWWAYSLYAIFALALLTLLLISHRKKLSEQRAINRHLRQLDRLKDEFLANTSHELRTPLHGIIGVAESLKLGAAGSVNQELEAHLDLIINSGRRLSHMVNEILDFKKLDFESIPLNLRPLPSHSLVQVVLDLLKPMAEKKSITLINNIDPGLPAVLADEERLQQIFYNLIGNGIKFTEQGEVTVSAQRKNDTLEFSVRDTGLGIADKDLPHIFEPFLQLDSPSHQTTPGTGIGLSLTKRLIELHNGSIQVYSSAGQGTEFRFQLPLSLQRATALSAQTLLPQSTSLTKPDAQAEITARAFPLSDQSASRARILVADDEPLNLRVIYDLLAVQGHKLVTASDGKEALQLLEQHSFELVILDVMMPHLSGFDVTRQVRKKFNSIELPVLLLSARNRPEDIVAGLEAGANDYIAKPIDRNELIARVETLLLLRQVSQMQKEQDRAQALEATCKRLSRYFPQEVAKQIVSQETILLNEAERRRITILFADLVGFTALTDRFEPEIITELLNEYLSTMADLVEAHQGVLNEVLGDGLVVFFGAPEKMSKAAQVEASVSLAIHMQYAVERLGSKWLEQGLDHNIGMRIGIHQDFATVGNFGSENFLAYRAVGSGVNLASRLQERCSPGNVLVSYPVYALTKDKYHYQQLREETFKGFHHPHRVCELDPAQQKRSELRRIK